ncbi:hypothetical protein DU52_15730 [Methanosarcina mazei]|uniref:Disaggregatase-related domain-containing protein n=1 Tax=Methanosarcina mazei TaxID=2209 RepID=A0A0F8G893_METMZ|nr:right-handed parallel beta-helix repeat-containing protein [Methanosarcina mazei]KKG35378.1 hypothetical protein DU52_15730 [Methanosarcina mazei]
MKLTRHTIIILFIFLLFPCIAHAGTVETNGQTWTTDGTADQVEINQAIQAGNHIILSGDFCIDEPIYVDSGTTLDGQGTSKITLDDNVNRKSGAYKHSATTDYANPMIPLIGQSDTEIENIEIMGISFDGNYDGNLDLIKGRGFYNIIFFKHAVNVRVHDNYFTNSHGDSCRMYRCSNIQYYNNEADHLGHEGLFCIESQNIEAWNNRIENCIDNSFRVNNCDNVLIHDNYITSIQGTPGSGPGIQIQQDLKGRMRVEVCNNYIVSTWGPGIWIVGTIGTNEENDIYVHDNAFLGTGLNGITWVSGIIWSSMDNVRVENNVFDSCYGGGITSFKVKGLSTAGSSFEVTATNNIFTDIQKRKNSGAGTGYAFDNNLDENHKMISDFNVLWGNEGNFKNVKQGANDLFQDPKLDSADTGWEWKNGAWYNEFVTITPGSRWNPSDDDTGEVKDDEDAPVDGEFDSIFDVLYYKEYMTQYSGNSTIILPEGASETPAKVSGTIEYYKVGDNYTTFVNVPTDGLSEIQYEVYGVKTTHTLMIGERTVKGVVFTETSIWEGEHLHEVNALKLPGMIPKDDIKVTCVTPTARFEPDLKTITTEFKIVKFNPFVIGLFCIVIIAGLFIRTSLKHLL